LNSGVNDRRGRGFLFSIVSILDILSGALPLMVDVRQNGSPHGEALTLSPDRQYSPAPGQFPEA
jgi:hypothetical protein